MSAELFGGSLTARRDAISRDYRIAFSMGPAERSDVSQGVYVRVWEVRDARVVESNESQVLLAGAVEGGYEEPEILFTYEGPRIKELDLAFDQNGNVLVCADRDTGAAGASELWLYWYNPQLASYQFEAFGPGRTPRAILDDPTSAVDSDILVFYLNDTNQRVEYRVQREFYDTAGLVPVNQWYMLETEQWVLQSNTVNLFIEEIGRTRDNRLVLLASLHNPTTGQYDLMLTETAPYPFLVDERIGGEVSLQSLMKIQTLVDGGLQLETLVSSLGVASFVVVELTFDQESVESYTGSVGVDSFLKAELQVRQNQTEEYSGQLAIVTLTKALTTLVLAGPVVESASGSIAIAALTKGPA